jgi:putative DNA primase/helicase
MGLQGLSARPAARQTVNRAKLTACATLALDVRRASEIEAQEIEWLWRDRLAIGKHTLFAGEPGLGKSQLSAWLAAAVSTGRDWPDGQGRAPFGNAIILNVEDDAADTIIPRLRAAGADCSRIYIAAAVQRDDGKSRRMFNLQTDLELLQAKIQQIGNVRLVIIDPVSSYLGNIDSHRNTDVRAVLEPLAEMASRLRVAVITISHFSKRGDGSANNRIIGSIAFVAAARAAFIISRDPDDDARRLFVPSKNNIAPARDGLGFQIETREVGPGIVAPAVCWDGLPVTRTADEILSVLSGDGDQRPAKADAEAFLREVLADGPVSVVNLETMARAAGLLSNGTPLSQSKPIRSAAKTLRVRKIRVGFGPGAGYNWSLPSPPCMPSPSMDARGGPV